MFPGYFLSAYVLGVRPDLPDSQGRIIIEPHLGDLTSAEGSVVTEFGLVPIAWKGNEGGLTFNFEVPAWAKAVLRLPVGSLMLDGKSESGKINGQRIVIEVAAGKHQGTLTPHKTSDRGT